MSSTPKVAFPLTTVTLLCMTIKNFRCPITSIFSPTVSRSLIFRYSTHVRECAAGFPFQKEASFPWLPLPAQGSRSSSPPAQKLPLNSGSQPPWRGSLFCRGKPASHNGFLPGYQGLVLLFQLGYLQRLWGKPWDT